MGMSINGGSPGGRVSGRARQSGGRRRRPTASLRSMRGSRGEELGSWSGLVLAKQNREGRRGGERRENGRRQ